MTRLVMALGLALLAWSLVAADAQAKGRWQQVENKTNCTVWNLRPQPDEKVTWTGACVNGKAEGHGTQVWRFLKDGEWKESIYTGEVKEGKINGRGVYVWGASGDSYEGDHKDNKMHGRGVYVWGASGDSYEGDHKDNKMHGRGVYVWGGRSQIRGRLQGQQEARTRYFCVDERQQIRGRLEGQ